MKTLGKISNAKFGTIDDYPFLMGLILTFTMPGSGIGCGGKYTVNTSRSCKWNDYQDRGIAIEKAWDKIHDILREAKVDCVEKLKGIPVEIEIENNTFQDFRILTEVL